MAVTEGISLVTSQREIGQCSCVDFNFLFFLSFVLRIHYPSLKNSLFYSSLYFFFYYPKKGVETFYKLSSHERVIQDLKFQFSKFLNFVKCKLL